MKRNIVPALILIAIMLLIGLLVVGNLDLGQSDDTSVTAQDGVATPQLGESSESEPTSTSLRDEVIAPMRTPVPTATPDRIEQAVTELAQQAGFNQTEFLGISGTDWINLLVSLLLVLIGFLIGTWLIRGLLPRLVRRTGNEFAAKALAAFGPGLRWLIVLAVLGLATSRLGFLPVEVKSILRDTYVIIALALIVGLAWRLVNLTSAWYREKSRESGREDELAPVIMLLTRVGQVFVVIFGLTMLLSYLGIDVTALAAALGIGGLAISLAAKDTIADAIAGFIILVDRPFRVGDRIEIQNEGTWGDVTEIGLRTTRIRTRDNRLVIVPNSIIGSNQVVNYTYPDPRYRIQSHVGLAYGTDIEAARQIIIDTVRQVEGVLPDKPVDALYIEMADMAMIFRVRWWIDSYVDTRRAMDRVHTALQHALDAAGIDSPFPTQNIRLRNEPDAVEQASRMLGASDDDQPGAG